MSEQQHHRRRDEDENLAYGEDYSQSRGYGDRGGGNRSLVGDTLNKLRTKVDQYSNRPSTDQYGYSSSSNPQQSQQYNQSYGQPSYQGGYQGQPQGQYQNPSPGPGQPSYPGGPTSQSGRPQQKQDFADKLFTGLQGAVQSIGTDVAGLLGTKYDSHHQNYTGSPGQYGVQGQYGPPQASPRNRFDSFVRERAGNDVKWYVDGCSYFWAVSEALERARESIWILDWWLTPELYLRRPPAANEDWRLDRVLQRVANRGVKINVIVYKEVTQALTLSSSHTKHALEALSPNIGVFRHPDHLPDSQTAHSSIISSLQGLKLDAAGASKLGSDALKGIYGLNNDVILYWAHHEKLCIIDKNIVFMGGLDMCFGRWDTNQHSISDAHPSDLNKIVFPGQDFNNARVMDFNDVAQPFQNKLDRTKSSRMGWSDISICLRGACVQDLCHHFTDRWNFIYDEKYNVRTDVRYSRLPPWTGHHPGEGPQPAPGAAGAAGTAGVTGQQNLQPGQFPPPPSSQGYTPPPWQATTSNQPRPTTPQQGGRPYSPQPPTGQYSQTQQQYGSRPHTPNPPSGQYSSSQQQTNFPPPPPGPAPQQSQQSFPPPPPGGPPQPSAQTQPSWAGHDQYQGSNTSQTSPPPQSQYSSGYQSSSNPSQPAQPQYSSSYQSPQPSQPSQSQYTAGYQPTPPTQPSQSPQPPQQQYGSDYQRSSQPLQQPQGPQQPYDSSYQSQVQSPPPPQQPQYSSEYQRTHSPQPPQQQYSTEHQQPHPPSQYTPYAQELPSSQSPHQNYDAPGSTRGIEETSDYYGPERGSERGSGGDRFAQYRNEGRKLGSEIGNIGSMIGHRVEDKFFTGSSGRPSTRSGGPMQCQLVRSCTKWSNGTPTEHSVQNAYIDVIMNSQHFLYIENQFFITATGDKQGPVKNQIGKALVDRILRAARNRERYHVIVVIPAIPAFAGDFVDDQSLGTRAICEFQYNSICRGGQSIMEKVAEAGFNPMDFIRFYNLRNYDRINYSATMMQAQSQSGVNYEDARKQEEQMLGAGYAGQGYTAQGYTGQGYAGQGPGQQQQQQYGGNPAQQYQSAAHNIQSSPADQWDSVASCYMLNGQDIRTVPWSGPPEAELDAFVSEELYIHSKVMIADDRVVICGSANLNDRSMLGTHDSEIALFINDPTPVQSSMAGRPYSVSRFAASLRRQLFRKHLGLVPAQDFTRPNDNFLPLGPPNAYDWGSPEDRIVSDPLSDTFLALWNTRARTNTEVYRKAFRAVPDDYVRSWTEYKEFYEYYFHRADADASGKDGHDRRPARVEYGHVVRDDFPGGASQLKEQLSKVKGTLVEMPLCFLQNEDIAKQGLTLNALTEPLYT